MAGEVMRSEIAEIPAVFERILERFSDVEKAMKPIINGDIRNVLILARGTSDNAAHFLKYLIETQCGLPVGLTSPSSVTVYNAQLHFAGTLVVALSQSGQSPDLVAYAQAAKRAGAHLISMTNDENSPLARVADSHLSLSAGPEIAVAASKSYAAELLLSYLFVCAWTGRDHGADLLPDSVREILAVNLSSAIDSLDLDKEIVILGRGFSYPNAREAALKIQETCKVSVQGLSTADYLHGPISALTPDTQVIFMVPFHLPIHSMADAVSRIRAGGCRILWCGTGGEANSDEITLGGSKIANEILASIADAALLQRCALELCVKNGLDPDNPKGLTKVTLTR